MRALALAATALLTGCAYYEDRPTEPAPPRAVAATIHGDTRFDANQRGCAELGAANWLRPSDGRIDLRIVWDYDEAHFLKLSHYPHLVRANAETYAGSASISGDTHGLQIRVFPERCGSDLTACFMHEFGHFVGLQHVIRRDGRNYGAVMSPWNAGHEFLVEDIIECRRVGLCPEARPKDVTTVTVFIDPSIPNVEPNYP